MRDLPPIPFERVPITPLPDAFESSSDAAWAQWDAAVSAGVFVDPPRQEVRAPELAA